jgi:ribosome recycling factor
MIDEVISETEARMQKTVESLKRDLAGIRTGRASPGLLEKLQVEYYGTPTPLQQLAQVSTPEPRTVAIQPYDRGAFAAIEKAIQQSDLGLTPNNDGKVIRVNFPPLTEERRRDIVKLVKKAVEEHKVAARNVRRDGVDMAKELEKAREISADELKRAEDRIQKITDAAIQQVDKVGQAKEAEVLEV